MSPSRAKEVDMTALLRLALMAIAVCMTEIWYESRAWGGEPAVGPWNPKAAAAYLDQRAGWWLDWNSAARGQETTCLSCHTTMPFALARGALRKRLGETSPGDRESRLLDSVRKRVDGWDQIVSGSRTEKDPFRPFYGKEKRAAALGTESILNALVLVNEDARRSGGKLSDSASKALDYLWSQQQPSGAWLWLDFGLRPWETEGEYYGAALAAVAVGMAGKNYPKYADVQEKMAALRKYLQTRFPVQPLHHRILALWASSVFEGVLSPEQRRNLIQEILDTQDSDGGWALPKLGKKPSEAGQWKQHGSVPAGTSSDGYATGLVVFALRNAGVPADDPKSKKALDWLMSHEKDGTWPAIYINMERDPNTNVGKFMRDASTAFAVLALTDAAP
jgi:squalene-hopene/tetraprenyl-beta-curcumene cyclase